MFPLPPYRFGMNAASSPAFTGPLDAYGANLTDAFDAEFRLLAAHTGGAFRVRESTGNTEAVIGFAAEGRIDATAFNAHIGAGSGFGVRWINQVVGGTDFIQTADTTKQGQVLLNQIGGGAVLKLDAVNDAYDPIRNLAARPFTIYLVEKGVGAGTYRTLQNGGSLISTHRNANNSAYIGGNISNFYAGFAAPHVATLVAPSGSGASYFVDGVNRTTTTTNTAPWGNLCLGASQHAEPANSCVCTVLVYNVAHDAATRDAIETILRGLRGF